MLTFQRSHAPLTYHPERNHSISRKRSKKQTAAIRQSTTRPTKTVTQVKAALQPVLAATPILSPQANSQRKHNTVHQDAPSTTTIAKVLP
ncbi:MAG TPA: hypothetical protein VFN35_29150 [Ktedonobacteraceae bacterium]|nr:hypothetical protein [Ktedonobacteraceae bacterium]